MTATGRRVVLVGPPDSVTLLLAERLSVESGTVCRLVPAPERLSGASGAAGAAGAAGAGAAHSYAAAAVEPIVVYRPPWAGAASGRSGRPNLADAETLFRAVAAAPAPAGVPAAGTHSVRHLVLLSSAAVVAPAHAHPGHVAEAPPSAHAGNPIARAWAELERLALHLLGAAPGLALTVLRPAAVAARDGGDYLARLLRARFALPLAGFDPSVQLLAPDDLATAVCLAAVAPGRGTGRAAEAAAGAPAAPAIYQVAPAGVVPVRAALRLARRMRLPLPYSLQRLGRALPARLGWAAPIEQLDWLRHSATVSGRRIGAELGFAPRSTSAAAVEAACDRRAETAAPRARLEGAPQARLDETPAPAAAAAAAAAAPLPASVPDFDDYGMDRRYIGRLGRTLFHFLHRYYWRIEVRGLEHVPRQGAAVLVGVHRGFMPWDGVMALHTLVRGVGRYPRFLVHPTLTKFPFLAPYMIKLGGIIACQENADWVLAQGEMVGMFPEGIQGAFTMYRDAYRLGKFARDEYVKMALRHGAPLVPFVTAGSAEIYPIFGRIDWRWFRRFTEWPFLPLGPNFPLPGLPLPSKWHTRFLPPIVLAPRYPPEAASDAAAVREISAEVRGRMQEALGELRRRRRSIFYGSVFAGEPAHEGNAAAGSAAEGGR